MLSQFDRMFQRAGFPQMLKHYGEPVVFEPGKGEPRPMRAIVVRRPPVPFGNVDNVSLPTAIVSVYNDDKLGVASASLDKGTDRVTINGKDRKGGPPVSLSIDELQSDSGGVCVLVVN